MASLKSSSISPGPVRDLRGLTAIFCCLMSAAGVGLGVHLSLLKFRMTYTPCLSPYGGCQFGTMSCDEALSSTWSTFLDLPISAWGAAFYLVTGLLAAIIAIRREAFGGTAAHLLVGLATIAVLVSAFLGGVTYFTLPAACPFCASLYVVSVLLLGGAYVTCRPPGIATPGLREVLRQRAADMLDGAFVLAFTFVVATGVQSLAYHGLRNRVSAQDGCPEPLQALPPASIKVGADKPKAILALFIDMTCSVCRKEFRVLSAALRKGQFPEPVQIWVYHTPRVDCDPAAFPSGYPKRSDEAANNGACLAATAVECMEKVYPRRGYELIGALFPLQEKRQGDEPTFTPERIGDRAVELGADIDPDDANNALFRCMNTDSAVRERITEHQRFAEGPAYKVPTLAVYPAVDGQPDLSVKPLYADGKKPIASIFEYVTIQAAVGAQR